ncbi:hypothetical protein LF41_2392 [Lysobacter dokdonensis DS-58]|uniref:Uncharacterized protein n=1 Tax=Lysobacter dokdonensis DS-58 TaxID=1300345 RepID=A0A0A2WNL5_9GAMM|nr:hypothetical protein LF41_2392 [Lysobacter dokdonensis DS-58]
MTACKTEAEAVRWCLEFAADFGIGQSTVAKLCGWKSSSFLSEIASESSGKRFPQTRIRKFSLATGCELVEQFHERQRQLREMTGKQTAHDKAREAVAAIRQQFERRSAA